MDSYWLRQLAVHNDETPLRTLVATLPASSYEYESTCARKVNRIVLRQFYKAVGASGNVRFDGKYTNNRVFAASYKVNFKNMPCYQLDNPDFTLAKGANTVDFQVTPFCRIKNESITYANGKITATFSVELGDAAKANKISNVAFCGNTQLWVGCNFFNLVGGAAAKKANVTPGDVITLEIDTTDPKNGNMFQYEQERYVRIAAEADGNGFNGNKYYNFSKIYKISADYSKIEAVDWDTL